MLRSSKMTLVVPVEKDKNSFQAYFDEKRHVIPLFSTSDIAGGFNQLSSHDKDYIMWKTLKSKIFPVILLPQDVRREIFTKMLGGDAESAEVFDTMPLIKAFEYYQRVKSYDSLKIGNKIYSVGRLFRLAISSSAKFHSLVDIGKPCLLDQFVMGKRYDLVTVEDYEEIQAMPLDISNKLELQVISKNYEKESRCISSFCCGVSCMLCAVAPISVIALFGCCIGGGCCCSHHYFVENSAVTVKL